MKTERRHWLVLNSWRCLLCSSIGLGFTHWHILSQSPCIYYRVRSLLLFNYTVSFPVTIDIIANTTLHKEFKPVFSALWISISTYRAAHRRRSAYYCAPSGVLSKLSWTAHSILHQQGAHLQLLQLWFSEILLLFLTECPENSTAEVTQTALQHYIWVRTGPRGKCRRTLGSGG